MTVTAATIGFPRIGPKRELKNPGCGLKTRKWPEVASAVENMVTAARAART